jgi:menaquinone-dependent protoporphyrinogen IX oxidase
MHRVQSLQRCDNDEMEQFEEEPDRPRVLVVTGASRSSILSLARAVASTLRDAGWSVEIGNALSGSLPPPPDYDAIVIVASAWARWRAIARYVDWFRESLAELPVVLVLVGTRINADTFCERVLKWRPSIALSLPTATRVATEVIALHARAKLTS